MDAFLNWNMDILRAIANIRLPFLDTIFSAITAFGEEMVIIVLLCAIYWCYNKHLAYTTGVLFFSSAMVVQGLKIIFRIPRPWLLDPGFGIVESARGTVGGYSFPSGHTQGAGSIYGTLGFWAKNRAAKVLFIALALLVGFSRMYLGVHTPLDVVVSLLLTLPLAWFFTRLFKTRPDCFKRDLIVAVAMLVLSVAICTLALALSARGLVEFTVAVDYCKQAGAAMGFVLGTLFEKKLVRFSVTTKKLWLQLPKFLLGMAGVLFIKEGLKLVIGTGLVTDTLRYFLMVVWVALLYPVIIKKLFNKKAADAQNWSEQA